MSAHSGGGRQADYCSRSCQAKAYRARHAHGTARDDSQWSALTARAVAAETEAAALRKQLAAAQRRVDKLTTELAAARTTEDTAGARQERPETPPTGTPALPPRIDQYKTTPRWEPVASAEGKLWHVFAGDVPIGTVRQFGSGAFDPTLPNGIEVYLGSTARTIEEAAGKLVTAYAGWAGYWHRETAARLTLLRPRQDGDRTAKWGGQIIGQAVPADASTGGTGWLALDKGTGAFLRADNGRGPILHYTSDQDAAEALLDHWRTNNTPPWGELVH
jgi:hypothetical protein